ncbi:hypothetical protein BLOT_002238 [Blomia tropicalis]|nr:hypothetical protein BLOT_002238 [Blomia tropicalis]
MKNFDKCRMTVLVRIDWAFRNKGILLTSAAAKFLLVVPFIPLGKYWYNSSLYRLSNDSILIETVSKSIDSLILGSDGRMGSAEPRNHMKCSLPNFSNSNFDTMKTYFSSILIKKGGIVAPGATVGSCEIPGTSVGSTCEDSII